MTKCSTPVSGSFENEALENKDRSTKHPKLKNKAPKTRKQRPIDRKRSTQKLGTGLSFINTRLVRCEKTLTEIDFPFVVVEILHEF